MTSRHKAKEQKKVIDATVINQSILIKAVKDYLQQNKIIPKDNINFRKLKVLSLSFLNIWKIQYLNSFIRLQKLQLDNNIIEKIENIEHLQNLTWLDLSFNNIKQIQGIDKLINLTDFSLYNNKIMILDGLHNCSKLNIFSIGNNQLKSFEEIIAYFGRGAEKKTRFKYLQVLNVYGNPFTIKNGQKDQEYQYHLVAHLPNLRYLDYIFIDDKRRKEIREFDDKFKTEDQYKFLQELRIEEQKQKQQQDQKRKKQNAKMHLLDGYSEQIVKIDDLQKIQKMHGLEQEIQKFTLKIKELVENMQKKIKQENEKKLQQIKKSQYKLYDRQKLAQNKTSEVIIEFQLSRKIFNKIYQNRFINKNWKDQAQKQKNNIFNFKDNLLNIEVQLIQDAQALFKKQILPGIQQNNKKIQIILSEQQKDDKNQQTGFFKKIEDEIKQFGIQLERISKQQIQRYISLENSPEGQQQYSSDPQLNNILANRQTILGTISTIKELLLEKKSKKQSEIDNELCTKDKDLYKKQYEERLYERNRKNIKNIDEKVEKLLTEVNTMLSMGQGDQD